MKVEWISIKNFKRFENLEVSFKNEILDEVSDRYLILGDNGTGKTTLLQAIALPLALATRRIQKYSEFDWVGFLPERYWRWGRPRIELEVSFVDEELAATRKIAQLWYEAQPEYFQHDREFAMPSNRRSMRLVLDGDYWRVGDGSPEERAQFCGRYYTQWFINKGEQSYRIYFAQLPGIFWFDQFRNLGANPNRDTTGDSTSDRSTGISYDLGVGKLRKFLIEWRRKQESGQSYTNDYLSQVEKLYRIIFPDRSVYGLETLPQIDSPTEEEVYFLLNDGSRRYDLVEMSAGEQSVFPILYDIVRRQIAYSVVLIDEVDLNLHPNKAQFLMNQLSKLSPTSQFITTTHSEAVNDVIGEGETFRLPGGALCL